MNQYQTLYETELQLVNGGGKAMSTLSGALSGATAGVKWCTPGGPWAMAGCGIVGGVIGGLWGYNAP